MPMFSEGRHRGEAATPTSVQGFGEGGEFQQDVFSEPR